MEDSEAPSTHSLQIYTALLEEVLSEIPSILGRLVYLAALRNSATGQYEHPDLARRFGAVQVHGVLRASHYEAFADWLDYDLERRHTEVLLYLACHGIDKKMVLEKWRQSKAYQNLIPASARELEGNLFLQEFELVLELLSVETDVDTNAKGVP